MNVKSKVRPPDHDHYTLIYDSQEEQFETVVPFIRDGLESGDRCLYVVHENTRAQVLKALNDGGVDVETVLADGDLSVVSRQDHHSENGVLDQDRLLEILESNISDALDAGYERLRTTGEMTWTLNCSLSPEEIIEYEKRINNLFSGVPCIGLCQYNRNKFSPAFLEKILYTHPKLLFGTQRCSNAYYQDPDAFDATTTSRETIDKKLQHARDQAGLAKKLEAKKRGLDALTVAIKQLTEVETNEIAQLVVETAARVCDAPAITLLTLDAATGRFHPVRTHPESTYKLETNSNHIQELAWEAITEGATKRLSDPAEAIDNRGTNEVLRGGAVFPIGNYGVLVIGARQSGTLREREIQFIEALVTSTQIALENQENERLLDDQKVALAEKNERLARLDRITNVFRKTSQILVGASSREEIIEAVCKHLADISSSEFVWIATSNQLDDGLAAQCTAGNEQGYLDAIALDEKWTNQEPTGIAFRTKQSQRVETIEPNQQMDHWEKQALKRGFRSVISHPLIYDESVYGVLSLYANTPGVYDEEVYEVLSELSTLVAHGISTVDQKQALVSESVVELKMQSHDPGLTPVQFTTEEDCRLELGGVIPAEDGSFRVFLTIEGASLEQVKTFATESVAIDEIHHVTEREDRRLYECTVTDACFIVTLLNHGAVPKALTAHSGMAEFTVHFPPKRSVREFIEMFTAKYPKTRLVARQERDLPMKSRYDFREEFEGAISERQLEILKTAYLSGYFEWPRQRTGEEIATALGVTQPTISRHLREAQRRIFSSIFDER